MTMIIILVVVFYIVYKYWGAPQEAQPVRQKAACIICDDADGFKHFVRGLHQTTTSKITFICDDFATVTRGSQSFYYFPVDPSELSDFQAFADKYAFDYWYVNTDKDFSLKDANVLSIVASYEDVK